MGKVVLVTGGSAGLGAQLAQRLASDGWRVYAASRRGTIADDCGGRIKPVHLDVTNDQDCRRVVETIVAETGTLDAIVCNAGVNISAAAEELPQAQAAAILNTNFWGVVYGCRAVLPFFRAQRRGTVVVIGSLAGMVAPPGAAYYAASKHAVLGFTESLQYEVSGFGVRVHLIEPGFIRTELASAAEQSRERIRDYDHLRSRLEAHWHRSIESGMRVEEAAQAIAKALSDPQSPFRIRLGRDGVWLPRLKAMLPTSVFLWATRKKFGLSLR